MVNTLFTYDKSRITPPTIKRLILWTCVIALSSAILQTLFKELGFSVGPQDYLSLSWWGIHRWFVWQPLSYLFIQELTSNGITFFYLVSLVFNMYLLWVMGASLLELLGTGPFLRLYFISGVFSGLVTLFLMPLLGQYAALAGAFPAIIALLVVWGMAFPESEIFLFFLIPIKSKWLIVLGLGAALLMAFSRWDLLSFTLYLTAIIFGYSYATLAWGWRSPFPLTYRFDTWLIENGERLRRFLPYQKKRDSAGTSKIIDIQTGKALDDDDAFVDTMLTKISKYGENSLSRSERRRLNTISERKMRDRN